MSAASIVSFPSGSWSLYFHDPEDTKWTPESYLRIGTFSDFHGLWSTMKRIDSERFLAGMFFLMRDPFPPLWEHRSNIHGGSYCVKVPEMYALETFQRYAAAAILKIVSREDKNEIIGVSISPKKGFHILKLWNLSCKMFHAPTDIQMYGDSMKVTDILYRPHVDQRM